MGGAPLQIALGLNLFALAPAARVAALSHLLNILHSQGDPSELAMYSGARTTA